MHLCLFMRASQLGWVAASLISLCSSTAGAFDFQASIAGPPRVMRGHRVHLNLAIQTSGGESATFSISASSLPSKMSWQVLGCPNPNPSCEVWGGGAAVPLILTPALDAPEGKATIKMTLLANGVSREATFNLEVQAVPSPVTPTTTLPPIPELSVWTSQMVQNGKRLCTPKGIDYCGDDPIFDAEYCTVRNDGEWVYFRIADYTGDASFAQCAQNVEALYRDKLVARYGGSVSNGQIYPQGLYEDFLRTNDAASKDALQAMLSNQGLMTESQYAIYIMPSYPEGVAQSIQAFLVAEKLGLTPRNNLELFVDLAVGYLDLLGEPGITLSPRTIAYLSEALIAWDARSPDPRVEPAVRRAATWLWENTLVKPTPATGETIYKSATEPTVRDPATNLLVAPIFAWLYVRSGDELMRDRGDALFGAGLRGHDFAADRGGDFTGMYRWTFEFVFWRSDSSSGPTKPSGVTTSHLSAAAVELSWQPSKDNHRVQGYRIYRDGVQVGLSESATLIDAAVISGATYAYSVEAFDPAGNVSPRSEALTVTIPFPGDPNDQSAVDGGDSGQRTLRQLPTPEKKSPVFGCQSIGGETAGFALLTLVAILARRRMRWVR
jgi:hypothetical protein